VISPDK